MRIRLLPVLLTSLAVFGAGAGDLNQRPIWPSTVYGSMLIDHPSYGMVTRGLVGWWRFDEGTGSTTADSSGNGNTGTLQNMEAGDWVTDGQGGYALDLDGSNEYVSVAQSSTLDVPSTGITVTARINMDDATTFRIARNVATFIFATTGTDALWMQIQEDGTGYIRAISNTALTAYQGAWVHVAGRWSGGDETSITLFVNGAEVAATKTSSSWDGTAASTMIGDLLLGAYTTTDTANGRLDNVRRYNAALTDAEIAAIAAGN